MKRSILQALALSLLLSLLGVAVIGWQVGGLESLLQVRRLEPLQLGLALAALYASFAIFGLRLELICKLLEHRIAHRHALRAHILGLFASAVTPGGSGGAAAIAISLDVQGMERPRAWAAALTTVSADVVFHAWATPIALAILYDARLYPRTPLWTTLAAVAILLTAVLAYFLLFRFTLIRAVLGLILRGPLLRFRRRGLRFAGQFLEANEVIAKTSPWYRLMIQALTALGWFCMFAVLLFIVRGFDVELSALIALAGQTVLVLIASIFPTPGGSGFLELALSWFLVRQGSGEVTATAVLVWRLLTYYVVFLLGPMLGGYLVVRLATAPGGNGEDNHTSL